MDKYKPKDSVAERVKDANRDYTVQPPEGVSIQTPAARKLWEQYTTTRDEWGENHLIELGRIVHLEIRIRMEEKIAATEDAVIMTRLGEQKENPRFAAMDRMVKQKASLIRLIGLNVNNDEAAKLNRKGKKSGAAPAAAEVVPTKERLKGQLLGIDGGKAG
jgi:hypothetical protein